MSARYDRPLNGCLLPDPWSTGLRAYPEGEFEPYYDFVRQSVQEHTNEDNGLSKDGRLAEFKDAILYGYQRMDRLVGRFLSLIGPDTTLIFCTALSQQPYTDAEGAGGRHFYRLRGPAVLTGRLGLRIPHTYHPVMSEQVVLRFEDPEAAESARRHLGGFRIGPRPAFHVAPDGADLMVQCNEARAVPRTTVVRDERTGQEFPFYDLFYQLDDLQSGHHHPDGMLWVRYPDRSHREYGHRPSVRSIAPAILDLFGLPRPGSMTCGPFTEPVSSCVNHQHGGESEAIYAE